MYFRFGGPCVTVFVCKATDLSMN